MLASWQEDFLQKLVEASQGNDRLATAKLRPWNVLPHDNIDVYEYRFSVTLLPVELPRPLAKK